MRAVEPTSARDKKCRKTRHASPVTGKGRCAGRTGASGLGGVCAAVCRAGARERARRDVQATRARATCMGMCFPQLGNKKTPMGEKSHHRFTGPWVAPSHPIRSHPTPFHLVLVLRLGLRLGLRLRLRLMLMLLKMLKLMLMPTLHRMGVA